MRNNICGAFERQSHTIASRPVMDFELTRRPPPLATLDPSARYRAPRTATAPRHPVRKLGWVADDVIRECIITTFAYRSPLNLHDVTSLVVCHRRWVAIINSSVRINSLLTGPKSSSVTDNEVRMRELVGYMRGKPVAEESASVASPILRIDQGGGRKDIALEAGREKKLTVNSHFLNYFQAFGSDDATLLLLVLRLARLSRVKYRKKCDLDITCLISEFEDIAPTLAATIENNTSKVTQHATAIPGLLAGPATTSILQRVRLGGECGDPSRFS
ncbi:hypothetical protein EVAR_79287_1 [Eumeta japonica]|uniref:Uncharacterized protein n=1 Tax=Eumeta variegata TaxID=151549 RepID=A0A4C1TI19_EUMVA|nr:hypothetical protein EVAR_79287_1 [Eumeta japonica]